MFTITKSYEFDAAHRLPMHAGKCKNLHGHRYKVELTFCSPILDEQGMVLDFATVKFVMAKILEQWDHALLVQESDSALLELVRSQGWLYVVFVEQPTAEIMAREIYELISDGLDHLDTRLVTLETVTVWETPTSSASYKRE